MKHIILCCVAILMSYQLQAQTIDKIVSSYHAYDSLQVQEKVYVQTDRTLLKPGDNLWFNTFLTNSQNCPSSQSEKLYAELISPKGDVIQKLTLPNQGGCARGNFQLNASAAGGQYKLRAYSYWQQNYSEEDYFEKKLTVQKVSIPEVLMKMDFEREAYGPEDKVIAIFSARTKDNKPLANKSLIYTAQLAGEELCRETTTTDENGEALLVYELPKRLKTNDNLINVQLENDGLTESISRSAPIVLNNLDIQLLPEGGYMVADYRTRVGVKVLNEFGSPADIKAQVVDKKGAVVADFETYHQGMGAIEFTPKKGEKYKLKVLSPVGIKQTWTLPELSNDKIGIYVRGNGGSSIECDIYSPSRQEINIVAQQNGQIVYSKSISANEGANLVRIPVSKLPIGIVQITLFSIGANKDLPPQPHAERLVFVNKDRKLNVTITSNKDSYSPREEVKMEILVTDETGKGVEGNFSMAVVDDKQHTFADDKQDDILSYLLMNSDLKCTIYEPNFYFNPEEEKADKALDYVMLTHGWRRFDWENVLQQDSAFVLNYQVGEGEIAGYLKIGDNLAKNQQVFLSEGQARYTKKKAVAVMHTDDNGFFKFKNVDISFPAYLCAHYHGEYHALPIYRYSEKGATSKDVETAIFIRQNPLRNINSVITTTVGIAEKDNGDHRNRNGSRATETLKIIEKAKKEEEKIAAVGDTIRQGYTYMWTSPRDPKVLLENQKQRLDSGEEIITDGITLEADDLSEIPSTDGNLTSLIQYLPPNSRIEEEEDLGSINSNRYNVNSGAFQDKMEFNKTQSSLFIQQIKPNVQHYSPVRKFYTPNYSKSQTPNQRTDFRKTIYWNPSIKTDKEGKASVSYYNSDEVTTFRAVLEGNSSAGQLAHKEHTYNSMLPFSITTKIPKVLSFGDTVKIPVVLKNNMNKEITGKFTVFAPQQLEQIGTPYPVDITIAADTHQVVYLEYKVLFEAGFGYFEVGFESMKLKDKVKEQIEVAPKGFPVTFAMSGQELEKSDTFIIKNSYEGSMESVLNVYPDILDGLMDGVESILNSPSGCFEQVSSSNYPNILALQLMEQTGKGKPDLRKKALSYLQSGYNKLTAYEISGGGFDWYGRPPAHEGLTAYGLVQFEDMKEVFDGIEPKMIERTKDFLLKRRDGKGGFNQNVGKYGFSGNKPALFNAYITWALSEANTQNLYKEIEAMTDEAIESEDLYRLSLASLTHFNEGNTERAEELLSSIQDIIKKVGVKNVKAESTVTYSYGNALNIETLSFAALAMIKSDKRDEALLVKIIKRILSLRQNGRFGSTQSTIMALRTLSAYHKTVSKVKEDGTLLVYINDKLVKEHSYKKDDQAQISIKDLHQHFIEGQNIVTIKFKDAKNALPYSFDAKWTASTPQSHPACPLVLQTTFKNTSLKVGETVRMEVELQNLHAQNLPSTMALVGIPAGLSLQPWQLKEMQEKQAFAFYELKDNYLILYYREMDASEKKTLSFDLKTEVPGVYSAPANAAYLYYGDEYKHWSEGATVQISVNSE